MQVRSRRGKWVLAGAVGAAIIAISVAAKAQTTTAAQGPQTFRAQLIALNSSGVVGFAWVNFGSDGKLGAAVAARGSTPGQQAKLDIHPGTASAGGTTGGTTTPGGTAGGTTTPGGTAGGTTTPGGTAGGTTTPGGTAGGTTTPGGTAGGTTTPGGTAGGTASATAQTGGCPTLQNDTNKDHLVSEQEAEAVYGPMTMSLGPGAQVSSADGSFLFAQTGITPTASSGGTTPSASNLGGMVVVVHGMTIDGSYDPNAPAACGVLVPLGTAFGGASGGATGGTSGATGGTSGATGGTSGATGGTSGATGGTSGATGGTGGTAGMGGGTTAPMPSGSTGMSATGGMY